jgi:long-chain acyl-CoA synthetase
MQKHRPTVFLGVPRLYEMFHRALMLKVNSSIPGRLLFHFCRAIGNVVLSRMVFAGIHRAFGGSVHAYLTGGASLDRKVDQDLRALGFKLVEGYGLTETSPLVAFNPFGAIRPGSVGPVMEGVEVRIISGEVAVRGPNVMKGYYNRPEDTARRLREGWFFTGDKGEFDSKGYLHLKGRTDEMIVLPSGKNIDPEEIEKNILDLTPMISEIGIMQEDGRLIALVHPDFDMLRRENILNFVENIRTMISEKYNATAAGFKRISKVIFVREPLPRTRLGKLKRYLMHGVSERKNMPSHEQAQSFEELSMIKSFIENLTGQNLSQSDHILLDIGLDSLERLQLSLYIEKVFGIRMSESDYMKYTTLLGLSEYIRDNKSRIEKTPSGDGHIFAQKGHERILPGKVLSCMGAFFFPLLRFYHRLKVDGPGNIPEGPCIFAVNHQSYLDVFIIIRALPRSFLEKTFFLAKDKKAYHNSLVRFLMTGANMIIIDEKSDIQVTLAKLATVLSSGFCVVIFPEGKRTRNGELGDFKKTFSIISKELGVPVVPVAIDGTYALMPYGSMFPRPGRVRLNFLKPVTPEMSDYQEIAKTVRQSISEVLL